MLHDSADSGCEKTNAPLIDAELLFRQPGAAVEFRFLFFHEANQAINFANFFQKKTRKIPPEEIAVAVARMKEMQLDQAIGVYRIPHRSRGAQVLQDKEFRGQFFRTERELDIPAQLNGCCFLSAERLLIADRPVPSHNPCSSSLQTFRSTRRLVSAVHIRFCQALEVDQKRSKVGGAK
jgi:Phage derived protein Gp49-like (DUF891)